MPLNPPTYTNVLNLSLKNDPDVPWEVRDLRASSRDVYLYLGTPVLLKKMYTAMDVDSGVAQYAETFDDIYQQSSYEGDTFTHGVGIVSVETQPGEWAGQDPSGTDPSHLIVLEGDTQPYTGFKPAPKYRGYGPGFLTYAILPDRPEDQWKLSEQGALTRTQTATVQLPWWPYVGDNDLLIVCRINHQGLIEETFERYQLKQMSPITMHGMERRGNRSLGPVASANRYTIGYTGELTLVPQNSVYDDTIYSVEIDR